MHESQDKTPASPRLYPSIEPFDKRMIDAGEGHSLYVEQSGNPNGQPVVVLHGGPGGGASPTMRRFFNPEHYRIILFDQRGCGRSKPFASVDDNTTWHLVGDIETIRKELGISRWMVFGGSWGATLSLVYAITHPSRAEFITLRGVFLGRQSELDWFYGGGAGAFWPEAWAGFVKPIPPDERDDMIAAYHKRLFGNDKATASHCAKIWTAWENALASASSTGRLHTPDGPFSHAFARLENHYFQNKLFLDNDSFILDEVAAIKDIPGAIVQGRLDMICPPTSANELSNRWSLGALRMIPMSGHALSEPKISSELVRVMDELMA
ncbi:prolyl aminopeptidase [Lentibacter algarum]|uniref:prolyl aminopeptidase n=1 Tax=Lentibacter algarum TaxID=576131 RepID=UPI001C06F4D9|nr:prolyl aminopeptidase [Lentibacter algarum]MBU2981074.1 prolyl aminopeptidase [Lentibacter algarum]